MAQYKVISSNLDNLPEGSIISDDDLVGINVEALIAGGHVDRVAAKQPKQDDKDK